MDLGASLCSRSKPGCEQCPLQVACEAYATDQVKLLPTPKPKKTRPIKTVRMLLLRNCEQQTLLEKRPPTGIWGGLWSLPEMPLNEEVSDWCGEHYQLKISSQTEHPVVRHTFSHFHLDITPCVVEVNNPEQSVMEANRRVWYKARQNDQDAPALGLAAPVSHLLNRLF